MSVKGVNLWSKFEDEFKMCCTIQRMKKIAKSRATDGVRLF